MAGLVFRVDRAALIGLGQAPGSPIHRWMTITTIRVDDRAKQYLSGVMAKVRTGNLRSSQSSRVEVTAGRIVGVVENSASYAAAVHNGTAPHEIRPRSGNRVLTGWVFDGQPVFTPVVHHPGTKARPFLAQALADVIHSGVGEESVSGVL